MNFLHIYVKKYHCVQVFNPNEMFAGFFGFVCFVVFFAFYTLSFSSCFDIQTRINFDVLIQNYFDIMTHFVLSVTGEHDFVEMK